MTSASTSTPVHGNYHGYYSKRPFAQDHRLQLLPRSLFDGARVLDIGCNEGYVTCEIAQSWGAKRVVGVDIDDTLVRAAWRRRRTVWSQQEPLKEDPETAATGGPFSGMKKRKRDSGSADASQFERHLRSDYFPASCEHMFGPLPIPPANSHVASSHMFPHNVAFRTADWVESEIAEDAEGYDVVIAFSVSKWIHLNGGDEGLTKFFRRVHSVLKPGGTFVLEPQEWETYGKAKRLDARLKENAKGLSMHPDDFERVLREIGFGSAEHLGRTGEGGFRRPVDIYVKSR